MAAAIRLSQQHSCSFDHLVGEREQPVGQIEAKRLSGLQVDDQLVFGRLLHRQIARLLAAQDTIDITRAAPEQVDAIRGIAGSYAKETLPTLRKHLQGAGPCNRQPPAVVLAK